MEAGPIVTVDGRELSTVAPFRACWDLGPFHPLLSGLVFFGDVVALPYRLATNPCCCYDCSAGYCDQKSGGSSDDGSND